MSDLVNRVDRLSRNQVTAMLALGLAGGQPHDEGNRGARSGGSDSGDDPAAVLRQALATATASTLAAAVADLKLPVLSAGTPGPLSFERLTGAGPSEVTWLGGKSFLDALTSPRPPEECVRLLAQYGQLLTVRRFPQGTRLAGAVIHTLASHALAVVSGRPAEGPSDRDAAAVLAAITRLAGRA